MRVCSNIHVKRIEIRRIGFAYAARKLRGAPGPLPSPPQIASSSRIGGTGMRGNIFRRVTTLPVVYLAAGEGKRLRPVTTDRPKAMIDLDGVSLAERSLRSLRGAGAGDVIAV